LKLSITMIVGLTRLMCDVINADASTIAPALPTSPRSTNSMTRPRSSGWKNENCLRLRSSFAVGSESVPKYRTRSPSAVL
jgi:hypothetical protein